MSDHLARVRDYELRDLVERLDEALGVLMSAICDVNENGESLITQRDLFEIESAIEAATDYLHELRMEQIAR